MTGQIATGCTSPEAAQMLARFNAVRAATLLFASPLSPEDMMVQSCPEASPVKWHLAHTSWFFETFVLTPYLNGYKPYHPDFHWLFNSYYNSLGEMPSKNLRSSFSRPGVDLILAYREHVDRAIGTLLEEGSAAEEDEVLRRITLGLEHEQQHLELIATDIKHALFTNPLHPVYSSGGSQAQRSSLSVPELEFMRFSGGLTEIGVTPNPARATAFAFDNETPRHTVYLQPFSVATRLVTVGEYLNFIEDNGYTRPELWLSEGWTVSRSAGWKAPLYWLPKHNSSTSWQIYTLGGIRDLYDLLATPVCHLSFFEADAYARWAGCRLPTEFEWEHAAGSLHTELRGSQTAPELLVSSPSANLTASPANMLEIGALHPVPASSADGLQQFFGDVWEWTSSGYTGYPGYRPLPGALGEYNGKFMSSQVILRGGSCVTPVTHIRPTYRNFFSPSTRWQFSGLRLAKDLV